MGPGAEATDSGSPKEILARSERWVSARSDSVIGAKVVVVNSKAWVCPFEKSARKAADPATDVIVKLPRNVACPPLSSTPVKDTFPLSLSLPATKENASAACRMTENSSLILRAQLKRKRAQSKSAVTYLGDKVLVEQRRAREGTARNRNDQPPLSGPGGMLV